jgi:hypothetical protein
VPIIRFLKAHDWANHWQQVMTTYSPKTEMKYTILKSVTAFLRVRNMNMKNEDIDKDKIHRGIGFYRKTHKK